MATVSVKSLRGLNPAEKRLVRATAIGSACVLKKGEKVRADIVRAIVCQESFQGRETWPSHAIGTRISGGAISGRLSFSHRKTEFPLVIENSNIADGIEFVDAVMASLDLSGSEIGELDGERAKITRTLCLNKAKISGACCLMDASISGPLEANNARFNNKTGNAILAQRLIAGNIFFRNTVLAGSCDLLGAEIKNQIIISEAAFDTKSGASFFAPSIKAKSIHVTNSVLSGAFDVNHCDLENGLYVFGSRFSNAKGDAISAFGGSFGSLFLRPFEQKGKPKITTVIDGGFDLTGARIKNDFELDSVEATSAYIALRCRQLQAASIFVEHSNLTGALWLPGATITSRLRIRNSKIISAALAREQKILPPLAPDDVIPHLAEAEFHAINLAQAKIGYLVMPNEARHRPQGIVDFSRAAVGTFTDYAATWPANAGRTRRRSKRRFAKPNGEDADHLVLDGFTYEHLTNTDGDPSQTTDHDVAKARMRWLRTQSRADLFARFKPQPWMQLSKVLAAQGYEQDSREVAIERRVALRFTDTARWYSNFISRMLHWLADYGFNPWKTFWWSVIVIGIFALIYLSAALGCTDKQQTCADQTVFVRTLASDFQQTPLLDGIEVPKNDPLGLKKIYPVFDPFLYSLDTFLPILDLGTDRYWRPNEHYWSGRWPVGRLLQWLTVVQQILGALLVSLMITGFTGLLTRDER